MDKKRYIIFVMQNFKFSNSLSLRKQLKHQTVTLTKLKRIINNKGFSPNACQKVISTVIFRSGPWPSSLSTLIKIAQLVLTATFFNRHLTVERNKAISIASCTPGTRALSRTLTMIVDKHSFSLSKLQQAAID